MGIVIDGSVGRRVTFRYEEVRGLAAQVADVSTLVAGREGRAVRVRDLLDAACPEADAKWISVEADDGSFAASVPLEALDDAVLVYELDGAPLPREKGGPFRLLIPDAARCGRAEVDTCANVKFVASFRLSVEKGRDTRPGTRDEHIAMHRREGHQRSR